MTFVDHRSLPVRVWAERLLILSITLTPLIVTLRYYWGGAIFAAAALPLAILLCFDDVRSDLRRAWKDVSWSPATIAACCMALWALASLLWTWTRHQSWQGFIKTAGCIIVALLLARVLRLIPRDRIFPPLVIVTALSALIGISTALSDGFLYRAVGCCHDGGIQPVLSGCAVVTALLVWPCVGWLMHRGDRLWAIGMIALAGLVVSVSHNGSAIMMWAAGLVTLVLASRLPRAVLFLPMVIATLGFVTAPFIIDLYSSIEGLGLIMHLARFHAEDRAAIWSFFDGLFWLKPWIGYGIRSEQIIGDPGRFAGLRPPPYASAHTHNTPLQILFDFGVVGGALTLAAIAALTRRLARASRPERYRYGIVVASAYLVGTLVNYGLWEWWLMTAMLLAFVLCRRLAQDDSCARSITPRRKATPAPALPLGASRHQR